MLITAVRKKGMMVAIFASIFISSIVSLGSSQNSFATEQQRCIIFGFFRIDNEQYSPYNITAGETIKVTGEIRSLANREMIISPILPIVDREKVREYSTECEPLHMPVEEANAKIAASQSEWQLVNASFLGRSISDRVDYNHSSSLAAGETGGFSIEIKSKKPGVYFLNTGFVLLDEPDPNFVHIGRGLVVHVMPAVMPSEELLQHCRELDIPLEECNQVTILQKQPTGGPTGGIRSSDTGFYLIMIPIGVGSALAGIVAFFTFRRLREKKQSKAQKQ